MSEIEKSNSHPVFKQNVVKKCPNPIINMYPEREKVLSDKVVSNARINYQR